MIFVLRFWLSRSFQLILLIQKELNQRPGRLFPQINLVLFVVSLDAVSLLVSMAASAQGHRREVVSLAFFPTPGLQVGFIYWLLAASYAGTEAQIG
jgi:hypothetical protein